MDEKIKRKIHYKKADNYRTIAATGAWGGVSPTTGEIVFDFIVDKPESPGEIEIQVDPLTGKQIPSKRESDGIDREAQIGVVLRPDIAISVGRWLIQKAKQAGVELHPEDREE